MPLPPNFLEELRARVLISDVVGGRVRLSRSNREWKGLCPFHKEKSPSFTVNDQKGFFHCFGCGAHGDAIAFLTRHDNLGFMEAVEQLAAQAGLDVPKATHEEQARYQRQKSLHDLVESACRFFEAQLVAPAGHAARDYLARRGLDSETIARFRLGYAPADSQAMVAHLVREGFDMAAILEVGLARTPEDGRAPFAFFRNRVMFPVADRRGRVVAFGARLIDGDGPKYINSPDGPLFHKGQLLYGLSRARQAAGQNHAVIVAEGYMDVIALVRAGFEAAVAPLGTALTEAQIQELWKMTHVPVLCFDGDEAGRRAAARAVDRILPLLRPDHSARVAFLPGGEDPDSLIATGGAAAMRDVLEAAQPLAEIVFVNQAGRHQLDTPEGRAGLTATLEAEAQRIGDRTVQSFYRRHFRERLDQAFPWQRPRGGKPPQGARRADRGQMAGPAGPRPRRPAGTRDHALVARILLAVIVNYPALFDELFDVLGTIETADHALDVLRREVIRLLSVENALDSADLSRHLSSAGLDQALGRLLSDRVYTQAPFAKPGLALDVVREGWRELWRRESTKRVRGELQAAKQVLGAETNEANWARVRALRQQASPDQDSE